MRAVFEGMRCYAQGPQAAMISSIAQEDTKASFDPVLCHGAKQEGSDASTKDSFECPAIVGIRSEASLEIVSVGEAGLLDMPSGSLPTPSSEKRVGMLSAVPMVPMPPADSSATRQMRPRRRHSSEGSPSVLVEVEGASQAPAAPPQPPRAGTAAAFRRRGMSAIFGASSSRASPTRASAAADVRVREQDLRLLAAEMGLAVFTHDREVRRLEEGVRGIVVVRNAVGSLRASSLELIESLRGSSLPVIAVVVDVPLHIEDVDGLIETVSEMRIAGAAEVIWSARSVMDLKVALEVAIRTSSTEEDESCTCERRAGYDDRRRNKDAEPVTGLFWQTVHMSFKGFPRLDKSIPSDVSTGAQIGPCIIGDRLGSGGFGVVAEAYNTETQVVEALKAVDKEALSDLQLVSGLWKEIVSMRRLDHEGIVKLHAVAQAPQHIILRMERAGSQNLFHIVKRQRTLPIETCRDYMAQLSDAVAHCHSRKVAHRDLKPENVVVTDCGRFVKIIDFGMAVETHSKCTSLAGTFPFLAPEQLKLIEEEPTSGYFPAPVDMWALGVILLEMLAGVGRIHAFLGWPKKVLPGPEQARELEAVFGAHGELTKLWSAHKLRSLEPDAFWLLEGLLMAKPHLRSTATVVKGSSWLQHRSSVSKSPEMAQPSDDAGCNPSTSD